MQHNTFRDLVKTDITAANIIITGIAFDDNASIGKGAKLAPRQLRRLSQNIPGVSQDGLLLDKVRLFDNGDFSRGAKETIPAFFARIKKEVLPLFSFNKFNFFIGGDHSVNIPLVEAFIQYASLNKKIPVYIHLDAHPDIMAEYLGNKLSHATPVRRALEKGIKAENIVLVGLRGFEVDEVKFFATTPALKYYPASVVHEMGINTIIEMITKKYKSDDFVIYFSYDIDANDPSFAPGTGTPEAFGLTSLQTLQFAKAMATMPNVIAMDLVEISPPLDHNDITSWLALKTLYEIFKIRGK